MEKMNSDIQYDPNNLNYRISLINSNFTNLSRLEAQIMKKQRSADS